MPTVRCLKGDRALLRGLRRKEGRKERDVVHDAVELYAKSKGHKKLVKERKAFEKRRKKEDNAKADAQAKAIKEGKKEELAEQMAKLEEEPEGGEVQ